MQYRRDHFRCVVALRLLFFVFFFLPYKVKAAKTSVRDG